MNKRQVERLLRAMVQTGYSLGKKRYGKTVYPTLKVRAESKFRYIVTGQLNGSSEAICWSVTYCKAHDCWIINSKGS